MACVMNLTVQYFSIYLALFVAITVKQFTGAGTFYGVPSGLGGRLSV